MLLTLLGCGESGNSSQQFKVSGSVMFDGEPVPTGEIVITPDAAAGNTGVGSYAVIKNGKYETAPGQGISGGDYLLLLTGSEGNGAEATEPDQGKSLFSGYELKHTFPNQDSTLDIEVPAKQKSRKK
tara:strand:+ start:16817 stop:17197 length:381 start_codon:yes stop_codon:yes gene_type:complete